MLHSDISSFSMSAKRLCLNKDTISKNKYIIPFINEIWLAPKRGGNFVQRASSENTQNTVKIEGLVLLLKRFKEM